ncbi:MAG: ATP-binding protein, partial [Steroidobacteraceae bacterium]
FEPVPLAGEPFVDGFPDEWPRSPAAWRAFGAQGARLAVIIGTYERYLYALLEIRGAGVVYDAPGADLLDAASFGDRIWIAFDDAEHEPATPVPQRQFFLAATGPGALLAHRIETREYGRRVAVEEPRIEAAWRAMSDGYRVEVRIPLSMVGSHFGVLADNRTQRGADPVSIGSLRPSDLYASGRLIAAPAELADYLARFEQPGVQLAVGTPAGAVLAQVNALAVPASSGYGSDTLALVYRRFLDRGVRLRAPDVQPGRLAADALQAAATGKPATSVLRSVDERRLIVAAAAPVLDATRERTIGVVQVAQTADRWLLLRDRALTRLLNLTLAVTALTVIASFAFAARLAFRLARLKSASESALTLEGRLMTRFPEVGARDELGDVARSFSALLARLDEHTAYLRTLAGKLAHEIRTPLTIVRSSLENLETEALPESARAYLVRAREGSQRLGGILQAMGAASRVEEAIGSAERVAFDAMPVVRSAVEAYREAFAHRRFRFEGPGAPCRIEGSPELLVQMLDKLVDNAVDFSPPEAEICVRMRRAGAHVQIDVENPGPPLPPDAAQRLFESLWQSRHEGDDRSHFGLGLYIARLIVEFHRGEIYATNLATGVQLRVRIPLLSPL